MVDSLNRSQVEDRQQIRKEIWTYLALTLAFSSVPYGAILYTGTLEAWDGLAVFCLMWSPGVAALVTRILFHRSLRGMGWGWGGTRWQLMSYALPLAYAGAVYIPVWLLGWGEIDVRSLRLPAGLGLGDWPGEAVALVWLAAAGTVGMIGSSLSALGEEIGWRGLLVPQLARLTTFTRTALLSGVLWAAWHYPVLFFADYRSTTPAWYAALCFTVMVIGISFAFAWLRLKSGSVWSGMLLHASHNIFIQGFFDPLTNDTGPTEWLIGEFGAGLALVGALVGFLFWLKRGEVERT